MSTIASLRMGRRARGVGLACAIASLPLVAIVTNDVRAAIPEEAPLESREQVAFALRALMPALAGHTRHVKSGGPGTLEYVIGRFAPAKFHPVVEGALPPVRDGARCPIEMGLVDGRFCVDRYEGSILERLEGGAMQPHAPNLPLDSNRVYVARSVAGVVPQAYISAQQAAGACKLAGKRLCHPVEWRAACGGSDGYAYPYGPTRSKGTCKDTGAVPMVVYHLAEMKRGWGMAELNDPRNNLLDDTVAKTGASPACVNDYGLYDMVGNLHEWSDDPNGTFQGGYWLDTEQHGDGCAYRTIAHPYAYHDYSTGFRCCADPTTEESAGR